MIKLAAGQSWKFSNTVRTISKLTMNFVYYTVLVNGKTKTFTLSIPDFKRAVRSEQAQLVNRNQFQ